MALLHGGNLAFDQMVVADSEVAPFDGHGRRLEIQGEATAAIKLAYNAQASS